MIGEGYGLGVVRNAFLATLTPSDFERLRPYLSSFELQRHAIIHEANKVVDTVYFIESGGVSRVARTKADAPIEVAMVGRFGFVGLSVVVGTMVAPHRTIVRLPGRALRISAVDLRAAMSDHPTIRNHLLNYVYLLFNQQAQLTLCNAKHELDQRLARWLLLAHDRVVGNPIPVTHDLLATILGVWRPGVSEALSLFERTGILERARGTVRILDRQALARRACECHKIIDDGFGWLSAMQRHEHRLKPESSRSPSRLAARTDHSDLPKS